MDRGAIEVETLLKIILVLVAILLAFRVLDMLLGPIFQLLEILLGIAVVGLVILWLLDRI